MCPSQGPDTAGSRFRHRSTLTLETDQVLVVSAACLEVQRPSCRYGDWAGFARPICDSSEYKEAANLSPIKQYRLKLYKAGYNSTPSIGPTGLFGVLAFSISLHRSAKDGLNITLHGLDDSCGHDPTALAPVRSGGVSGFLKGRHTPGARHPERAGRGDPIRIIWLSRPVSVEVAMLARRVPTPTLAVPVNLSIHRPPGVP